MSEDTGFHDAGHDLNHDLHADLTAPDLSDDLSSGLSTGLEADVSAGTDGFDSSASGPAVAYALPAGSCVCDVTTDEGVTQFVDAWTQNSQQPVVMTNQWDPQWSTLGDAIGQPGVTVFSPWLATDPEIVDGSVNPLQPSTDAAAPLTPTIVAGDPIGPDVTIVPGDPIGPDVTIVAGDPIASDVTIVPGDPIASDVTIVPGDPIGPQMIIVDPQGNRIDPSAFPDTETSPFTTMVIGDPGLGTPENTTLPSSIISMMGHVDINSREYGQLREILDTYNQTISEWL